MIKRMTALKAGMVTCAFLLTACSDDEGMDSSTRENTGGAAGNARPASNQQPPHGHTALLSWLQDGAYDGWACEPEIHEARSPSPHGFNRICANDVLAADARGTGNWKKGAAAVKELHASADSTTPIGYAVYEKTEEDSAGGANWYWYEIVPADHPAAPDPRGVVADGLANKDGPELKICVGCHKFAGDDPEHTPSEGGRDQVYTPVGR